MVEGTFIVHWLDGAAEIVRAAVLGHIHVNVAGNRQ